MSAELKALVLAAGRGRRMEGANPAGNNKCLLPVGGAPLLRYSLDNAIAAGAREIVLVVGYGAEAVRSRFGGAYGGVPLTYVWQRSLNGLVGAIEAAGPAIGSCDFLLCLGDEWIRKPRVGALLRAFREENLFAACGVLRERPPDEVRKTYAVLADAQGRVARLFEKPLAPPTRVQGTGLCLFRNELLDYVPHTPVNPIRAERELADLIQLCVDDGRAVRAVEVGDDYLNVNTPADLDRAWGSVNEEILQDDLPGGHRSELLPKGGEQGPPEPGAPLR